jgi:C2H2-type zinc finger
MSLKLLLFSFISRCRFTDKRNTFESDCNENSKTKKYDCVVGVVGCQIKGIGSHGSGDAGGILSNRLSLPLPLTACHRCDVCGKLLSTKLTLKRHKEQQHLQPLNNAVCNLCHKVFRTLNSLNNHKSIYHRRQKHHLYSGHPAGQNMPAHHLSQLPQQNAAKLDFI